MGHLVDSKAGAWRQAATPTALSTQLATYLSLPAARLDATSAGAAGTLPAARGGGRVCGPASCPVPYVVVPLAALLALAGFASRRRLLGLGRAGLSKLRSHRRLHELTGAAGGRWDDLDVISQVSYNLDVF